MFYYIQVVIIKENSRASGTDASFVMVGGKNFW